ncbi:Eco57I restriction-modification methylase domain-containing protein [Hymenobacter rubripertinctus]|uniref:site-specific DNA-methyltransferase (adenine-specific) n=1 Tax=Hymenobacter rubripertinctus TaxID=2029981 RepID=A0A418R7D4_9BACT|nr:TaqI-like C-terminal specificity domain-containing protein [Hymenobacter rubripertinctus]RIY13387.1 hypothetical protein D0T11_02830 [Hymenobacter rubripertinctus]
MPELLPLFPAAELPAPFTRFAPATALPDFAERVRHLRHWQQAIKDRYVHDRKEEVLQAEFLNLLFGQVLGYEYQATTHRQLELELKTLTDGTKPDGALGDFVRVPSGGLGGPVRAVVELKDARTALDAKQRRSSGGRAETPVEQAFSYPSKYGATCRWVLVSNFVELRLYAANDQLRAEVFNLETLPDDEAQLRRFFALLLPAHLLPPAGRAEAPLDEALHQRQQEETKITKAFYKDYRAARRQLLDHLIEQNPDVAPLELLAHTQKLLDRVIFVCFCEDKNIIPRHTFRRLLDAVRQNVFDPADDKVYRTVRGLFQSIDKGNPLAGINRFNGGLFAEDPALDALRIKDRTLTPVIQLEQYDFASDLNVNILGHIFEQSLSDLEQERARLSGEAHNPKKGKRKQDGIFYTPEYITRYIVRQAVGGWLQERRQEAGLDALPELTDDDRASIRIGTGNRLVQPTARVQRHMAAWEQYGQRLEGIRVLDPACGSGAFLNEAFGYLLREGEQVNRELAGLRAGQYKVFDFDRHILQHNLYGVDLNPESVDITRLSLWLQTANPGKPLTSLDHSIRCGNSLISDPAVAGDRAFDWPTAFPEVFAQGGFDVVIGNPPYVRSRGLFSSEEKRYLSNTYATASYQLDLYKLFIEKSLNIIHNNGYVSFITPSAFLVNDNDAQLRHYLIFKHTLISLTFPTNKVFQDAEVKTVIFNIKNNTEESNTISFYDIDESSTTSNKSIHTSTLKDPGFIINQNNTTETNEITDKISKHPALSNYHEVNSGMKVRKELLLPICLDNDYKPFILGKDIGRYTIDKPETYVHYTSENEKLYSNQRFRTNEIFEQPKILIRQIPSKYYLISTIDKNNIYTDQSNYIIYSEKSLRLHYTLSIVSSRLIKFYFDYVFSDNKETFPKIKRSQILELPIPNATPAEQQPFITAAEALLLGHKELHEAEAKAARLVRAELGLTQALSGKLALSQPWPTWSKALEKALGRKLSLPEKSEWSDYLTQFQQQQQQRRATLQRQDDALDKLVYQLYQLTDAEIALVEGHPAPAE